MARIIVTALAALSMLYVGIQALSFRAQSIDSGSLSGANATAYNLTDAVLRDSFAVASNALPRLFIVVLLALLVGLLALTR